MSYKDGVEWCKTVKNKKSAKVCLSYVEFETSTKAIENYRTGVVEQLEF